MINYHFDYKIKTEIATRNGRMEERLEEDDNMARFMTEGRYNTWQSQETNPHRLLETNDHDPDIPRDNTDNRENQIVELLAKHRRQLKTFLGQVAKRTSRNMYATIVRHATSLDWI